MRRSRKPNDLWHYTFDAKELEVQRNDRMEMIPPHDHNYWEIVLVLKGRAEHFTSRRRTLITAGDILIIRPGHWHTYFDVRELGVHKCKIGAALFRSIKPLLQSTPSALELFWRGPAVQAGDGCCMIRLNVAQRLESERILDAMLLAFEQGPPHAALAMRGHLLLFLSLLARAAEQQWTTGRGVASTTNMKDRPAAAADAVDLLETRYAEPLTMADLTRAADVSAAHLTRIFHKMTGQTPMRYLTSVRIQRACLMLSNTPRSIGEIAVAVGWRDQNLFARRFRTSMGISPRAYRQGHSARRAAANGGISELAVSRTN